MSDFYFSENHTAEEWREMARGCYKSADESFERCDTDGFLSQWASGQMASIYEACAVLAENGGMWELDQLQDLAGNDVNARIIRTQYGVKWGVIDPETDQVIEWLPYRPARESTLAKKGYKETKKVMPAIVQTYGISGSYQIGVRYVARWNKKGAE
jgi:hypothetical protein